MKKPLHRRSMEDRRSRLWAFSSRYLDIRSIFGEIVEAASTAWIFSCNTTRFISQNM